LGDGVTFFVWPTEKRPLLERGRASLHAKAAVADDHTAFVTSANLTGHGITENMELGLLVRGGPIPRRLSEHFRELIAEGTLAEIVR
jgi:phosphatidylserine/phosphatidylglycerophosphate/cardiolipin synthase-like enzyme